MDVTNPRRVGGQIASIRTYAHRGLGLPWTSRFARSGCWLLFTKLAHYMRAARLILSLFLSRSTEELYTLRDGKFDMVTQGQGMMISSSVNGSQFAFYAQTMLSPLEVAQMAQLAIDHREAGWCRPTTRTTVRFM